MKNKTILAKSLTTTFSGLTLLLASASYSYAATNMLTDGYTTQPIGHYEFCKSSPRECKSTSNVNPHVLTRADWSNVVEINNRVNMTVQPLTDMEIWGRAEVWSYPTNVGDCEDYALLKRKLLIKAGIAPGNLLITVVKQPNGDGHAVLTVRTDHGDFILDNLAGAIKDWRDTPYTYLKRQASNDAGRWVTINDTRRNIAQN